MLTRLSALFLVPVCCSSTLAAGDPFAFFAGTANGFIIPSFENNEIRLEDGFVLGFGASLGVRVAPTVFMTASATYFARTGTESFSSFSQGPFQMHTSESRKTFREIRLDLGPLLRTELGPSLRLNPEVGVTYLALSLGTSINGGTPFWGAYAGCGLEHTPTPIASLCFSVRYRYLRKQSADFGGVQIQAAFRFLIGSDGQGVPALEG